MKKYHALIWIILFLNLTILPILAFFFLEKYSDLENRENRKAEVKPVLRMNNYKTFPEEYEAYFDDRIPFRNQLIRFNNTIDYYVFKQSSNDNVCIGKDGWLFYSNKSDGNPVEQSLGYWNFSDEELEIIAANLESGKEILESSGIDFVLFIAPNKETIYIDKLPDYYEIKSQYTATDCLVDYLRENTDITIVYPKEELMAYRVEDPDMLLYYKLDTHWNSIGAYIGAQCLTDVLGIELPPLNELSVNQILTSRGDLTDMLNIEISDGDIDYKIDGISELSIETIKLDFATEFVYHTSEADPRTLVVCRDSFSTALAPSLAAQFEDSFWIHNQVFDQQQIFDYGADIFVLEVVERQVRSLEEFRITEGVQLSNS